MVAAAACGSLSTEVERSSNVLVPMGAWSESWSESSNCGTLKKIIVGPRLSIDKRDEWRKSLTSWRRTS